MRVSMDKEIDGLDEDKHGGAAYAFDRTQHTKEVEAESTAETKDEDVSSLHTGSPPPMRCSREVNHMDVLPDYDEDDEEMALRLEDLDM